MSWTSYWSRPCLLVFALGACVGAEHVIEDLGTLADDKSDTSLPRTVEVVLDAGESKRFRIKSAAFVANLAQDDDVLAQLTAKHYELELESGVSRAPRLDVSSDGTVRNWTLTVSNRGDATLDATVVIDVPRGEAELGIVSDIDQTVLPPEEGGMLPAVPGMRRCCARSSPAAGRREISTSSRRGPPRRSPRSLAWMAMHGVPQGPIDTGISGVPWVAQAEKVRDISRIFDTRVQQSFVLLGDTSHRDPEVYAEILAKYPARVSTVFIHKVNTTVPPARVEGMHLITSYAEAAAIAFGEQLLTEAEARTVMTAAQSEGLAITDAEIDALIDAAR